MATELPEREQERRKGRVAPGTPMPDPGEARLSNGNDERLAKGLGWFSVGLGMAEVAAPGVVARLIGVRDSADTRALLRAAGVREIATGMGMLAREKPKGWARARIGGDVMDLTLLGLAFRSSEAQPRRLAAAAAAVAGVTALDVVCSRRLSDGADAQSMERVVRATTINRPVEEVYRFWRGFERLPQFMRHLESVKTLGPTRSHWVVRGPAGTTVEWDAETVEDVANSRISWRSLPGAEVENRGTVQFKPAPGKRGTEVIVELEYSPPGGRIGRGLAIVLGEEPEQQLQDDLRRFKQVMETGEIARTQASESLLGMARPGQHGKVLPHPRVARRDR